jgi:hypothetical protein
MVLTIPGALIAPGILWRYYPGAGGVEVPVARLTEPPHPP